jgi:cytochrome c-type biogenesis protein CcmH
MTAPTASQDIDVSLIKSQLQQLKEQHDSGALNDQAYAEARGALERRLLDWVLRTAPEGQTTADHERSDKSVKRLPIVLIGIAAVAILVGGFYIWTGRPAGQVAKVGGTVLQAQSFMPTSKVDSPSLASKADDISIMADKLAARLKLQPNDAQGWAILARSYDVLGNMPDALKAYETALKLLPADAALAADYSKALTTATQNTVKSGSGLAVKPISAFKPHTDANATTVSGTIKLSPTLAKSARPEDALFVVARPVDGSRMPLAILRKQVKDLPLQFALDDSMGMSPNAKLSIAGQVIVVARISKSGNAIPETGDLSGQSAPVAVGAKGVNVEINTAVKL